MRSWNIFLSKISPKYKNRKFSVTIRLQVLRLEPWIPQSANQILRIPMVHALRWETPKTSTFDEICCSLSPKTQKLDFLLIQTVPEAEGETVKSWIHFGNIFALGASEGVDFFGLRPKKPTLEVLHCAAPPMKHAHLVVLGCLTVLGNCQLIAIVALKILIFWTPWNFWIYGSGRN